MEKVKGIDLAEVGHERVIEGVVLGGKEDNYLLMLPGAKLNPTMQEFILDTTEWEKILRQMDLMEVEVTNADKLPKVILRKSQRNIDQAVAWKVYRRDGFKCRYCGNEYEPMTVDHLVLWEVGGPTIESNLLTSCKKCNRTRGNTPYDEWLQSEYYKKVSAFIPEDIRIANELLVKELDKIPITVNKRRR